MDPFAALNQAGNCLRLAEDSRDRIERENYLRSAKVWLERIDMDAWLRHEQTPAIIIASDEK